MTDTNIGKKQDIDSEFVHLSRMISSGKTDDINAFIRRTLRAIVKRRPDLTERANMVLEAMGNASGVREVVASPIPVDGDSRLELLRREMNINLDIEPVWPLDVAKQLEAVLEERKHIEELNDAGISPSRSLLFVGPPGVGKTLAARWLGSKLSLPILTLDLAGVMSSFLGRTGNNIRVVLDYAKRAPSILLLDEFDAVAKRRDDSTEIGELKRLVTVLLQAIDDWPASGLLIAATNHPELLDPAVWRRFDHKINFPMPSVKQIEETIQSHAGKEVKTPVVKAMALLLYGESFAEVVRATVNAHRESIIFDRSFEEAFLDHILLRSQKVEKSKRMTAAELLLESGLSQRRVSELTGVARDTLRIKAGKTSESIMED